MYAIIKTGGKQYRVEAGLKLKIEQIPADIGSELLIDQVLMIADGAADVKRRLGQGNRAGPGQA